MKMSLKGTQVKNFFTKIKENDEGEGDGAKCFSQKRPDASKDNLNQHSEKVHNRKIKRTLDETMDEQVQLNDKCLLNSSSNKRLSSTAKPLNITSSIKKFSDKQQSSQKKIRLFNE